MKKLINHIKTEWYKYLLEVIVIMVGILGAYALNNWNEERKEKTREIQLLSELHNEIEITEKRWIRQLDASKREIASKQAVINVIRNELSWHDSLQQHFNRFLFFQEYIISRCWEVGTLLICLQSAQRHMPFSVCWWSYYFSEFFKRKSVIR